MSKSIALQTNLFKDGVEFNPQLPTYCWERANKESNLLIIVDQWKIPKGTTVAMSLPLTLHDDSLFSFFRLESGSKDGNVKVLINGATNEVDKRAVSPDLCISKIDLTAVSAFNTDTKNDENLQLVRVIPTGLIKSITELVTATGARKYIELLDTPNSLANQDGYQVLVNGAALEHLPVNSKVLFNAVAKTADYTVLTSDSIVRFNATSANLDCNLPAASSFNGRRFTIKSLFSSTYQVIVKPNGSDRIEDSSSYKLVNSGEAVTLYSNGTNWEIESTWQGL